MQADPRLDPQAPPDSQWSLMRQRRFAPMFWVQFLGAANDNVFKYAFTLLATYSAAQWGGLPPELAGFVIGGLFIAPYLLFSATSGQIADKLEKSWLVRRIKEVEIAIMGVAAFGFAFGHAWLLYACVFLMGLHSTVFGPVKYAYLPQHLRPTEVTGGNGLIEMGTFVAILVGTIAAGVLVDRAGEAAHWWAAGAVLLLAMAGRIAAGLVPSSPAADPSLRINWNPATETLANLRLARRQPAVFNSLLGISWMWFFGSIFLTSFPSFAKDTIGGSAALSTLLLAVFSVGIGMGSMLCERLSGHKVEIGLVPFGSIGMTVFGVDLYFAATAFAAQAAAAVAGVPDGAAAPLAIGQFLAAPGAWRILVDMFLLAAFAGLYSVPLYALIQTRSDKSHTARIVAANNIVNAAFMIVASLMAAALLGAGLTIPQLFLVTALLNAVVAVYIYRLVPEFLLRFLAWMLMHTVYRLRVRDAQRIPAEGPALLVCNHVSFADAVVIMGASGRPIRFVMDHRIFETPLMRLFFRDAKAIPIASAKHDPAMLERAFDAVDAALADGELVCLFPEGAITRDGLLQPFRAGVARIIERRPVPVVPMALKGLWGSFFSRFGGQAFSRPIDARMRRGLRSRIELVVGEPLAPEQATPQRLQARVQALLDETASNDRITERAAC